MEKYKKRKNCDIYLFIKRLLDIIIYLIGCIILFSIIILIKLLYVISGDFKTIFFSQIRIGKNGKEFKLYKFRTMIVGADEVLEELLKNDEKLACEYKLNKKLKHDPRVTKVGKIVRRTSIDELPQMINVLKGDMSIVGNRPYLPKEKKDIGEKNLKHIVKFRPGLTGIWQVSRKNDRSFKRRVDLEKEYSKNCNLKYDIKIFFMTFNVIFKELNNI